MYSVQTILNEWILDIIDFLREFPLGRRFAKTGVLIYPPRALVIREHWPLAP